MEKNPILRQGNNSGLEELIKKYVFMIKRKNKNKQINKSMRFSIL